MVTHIGRRTSNTLVVGLQATTSMRQDLPSLPSQASTGISVHSQGSKQSNGYTRIQSKSISVEATTPPKYPPSLRQNQLSSSSDIKLPPSMKSKGASTPDDDQEETIHGIHYPPSWGQYRSMSPQGASRKISEGSSESFYSAESPHGADTILSSLEPPKTKIMVSLYVPM